MRDFYKLGLSSVLLIGILSIHLQQHSSVEAKKIKLKDLKKAKKYAYLLATQKKKFYAIPIPMPLPVFVKRQQIYTQVPVVPRYVQQPPSYQQQQHYQSYNPYEYSMPEASYGSPSEYASSGSQHYSMIRYPQVGYYGASGGARLYGQQFPLTRGRYFSQLANGLLSQGYPSVLGVQKDVVGKLLSGQAKVLPPSQIKNLLFSSKSPTQYATEDSKSPSEASSNSTTSASSSSSSPSPSASSSASSSAQEAQDKPSASELYPIHQQQYSAGYHPMDPFALAASHSDRYYRPVHYAAPYLAAGRSPYHNSRAIIPVIARHPGYLAAPLAAPADMMQQYMAAAAAAAAAAASDSQGQQVDQMQLQESQLDPQEQEPSAAKSNPAASGNVETEIKLSGEQQRLAQEQLTILRKQQLQAIHSALIRRKLEAQLAEANTFALAAHQLGASTGHSQIRLINF